MTQHDAEVDHGCGCTEICPQEQHGDDVYRLQLLLLPRKILGACRAQRGRSCERGVSLRGDFPLIGSPFSLGKKIFIGNSAMARTNHEGFGRPEQGFMPIWGAKVTQVSLSITQV